MEGRAQCAHSGGLCWSRSWRSASWPGGPVRWPGGPNQRPRLGRPRQWTAPRSPSPWARNPPASTRTSSTTAASGRSTTTSTRRCSPARRTASWRPAWRLRCRRRSTTRPGSSRSTRASRSTTASRSTPTSVVATINRMVGLVERGETDNDGFYATLVGAEAVDDYTVRIMTDGPDGVLPARMYWLKQIPASAEETPDMSDEPIGTGPVPLREPQPGCRHRDRRQRRVLGRRRHDRPGHVRVLRRRGDPPRRPEVGALRPDHQPRAVRRRAGAGLRIPSGPGAPDPHPRCRRGDHRRRERPPGPQPRRRQGRHRREHVRRVRHGRRRSAAVAVDPRLQRGPRAVSATTRRRPSACSRRLASPESRSS